MNKRILLISLLFFTTCSFVALAADWDIKIFKCSFKDTYNESRHFNFVIVYAYGGAQGSFYTVANSTKSAGFVNLHMKYGMPVDTNLKKIETDKIAQNRSKCLFFASPYNTVTLQFLQYEQKGGGFIDLSLKEVKSEFYKQFTKSKVTDKETIDWATSSLQGFLDVDPSINE